jgi:hypothetical protein
MVKQNKKDKKSEAALSGPSERPSKKPKVATLVEEKENPASRERKEYIITHGFDPTRKSVKIWDFSTDDGDFSEDGDVDSIREEKGVNGRRLTEMEKRTLTI